MRINDLEKVQLYFQKLLLEWFARNGRDFPWRHTQDAYSVLVAEKLLQQTSIKPSVVTAYQTIITQYPNIESLAQAEESEISQIVSPLGLRYRALELIKLARQVQEEYQCVIPRNLKELMRLRGVGDYIARAILSFAYLDDDVVVDVNVARILYRVFDLPGKFPENPARKRNLYIILDDLMPKGKSNHYNWAMIDLGSLICKHSNPKCSICPLKEICFYAMKG